MLPGLSCSCPFLVPDSSACSGAVSGSWFRCYGSIVFQSGQVGQGEIPILVFLYVCSVIHSPYYITLYLSVTSSMRYLPCPVCPTIVNRLCSSGFTGQSLFVQMLHFCSLSRINQTVLRLWPVQPVQSVQCVKMLLSIIVRF